MATRQGTTVQDLDVLLDDITTQLGDMSTMIEERRSRRLRKIIN